MNMFQDSSGMPIKFFLQKDVPDQEVICNIIVSLGGRVEEKIPRSGFVLIVPGTQEAERLRICWDKGQERPDRYFVPYTYVEACKAANKLLKQIFVENGEPIKFHIDSSIANINMRASLSARIAHSGGDPNASAQSARVILADANTNVFQNLIKEYMGVQGKYVESYNWVKKCVENEEVSFTPFVYKNPGGRRAGEERTQFTTDDEVNLCRWIAEKIPYKETGGRTGNRLYQQLVEKADDPGYDWVKRHTWQSWRERYKKNAARLDTIIARMVDERKPGLGEKGQYGYVRKPEEKPVTRRRRRRGSLSANAADSDEEQFVQPVMNHPGPHITSPSAPHMQAIHMAIGPHSLPQHEMSQIPHLPQMFHSAPGSLPSVPPPHMLQGGLATFAGGPMDPPLSHPSVPTHPGNVSMQSNLSVESDPEWAVKEGNHPTPAWAKRKLSEEHEDANSPKRQKIDDNSMHVVDQSIREIAHEYRFTIKEVQAYYDKCGAMDRTRSRFKKMRETLDSLEDSD